MQSKQETDGTSGPARRWRRWALAGLSAAMLLTGGPAIAGDAALLKDLERERAALLDALLDPERTAGSASATCAPRRGASPTWSASCSATTALWATPAPWCAVRSRATT